MTFAALCEQVGQTLGRLGYDQRPEIDGPDEWVNAAVPWLGRTLPAKTKTARKKR